MLKEARIQIKLSPYLKDKLTNYAKYVDLSASQVIRLAVIDYLKSKGVKA